LRQGEGTGRVSGKVTAPTEVLDRGKLEKNANGPGLPAKKKNLAKKKNELVGQGGSDISTSCNGERGVPTKIQNAIDSESPPDPFTAEDNGGSEKAQRKRRHKAGNLNTGNGHEKKSKGGKTYKGTRNADPGKRRGKIEGAEQKDPSGKTEKK